MKYLLDTQVFLWWSDRYTNLSGKVYSICEDTDNELLLSIVSIWEIQIKVQLEKLQLPDTLKQIVTTQQQKNNFDILPIHPHHIYGLGQLAAHHKDPFDRMLISQALYEGIPILTKDDAIKKYPVKVIW